MCSGKNHKKSEKQHHISHNMALHVGNYRMGTRKMDVPVNL